MKRSPMPRSSKPMRRTRIKPSRRTPRTEAEREASALWKAHVGPCQVCPVEGGRCSGTIQGHHALAQRTLKRHGLRAYLWDLRNKVDVCEHRHEQITTGYKPLPRELFPASVFEFAAEVGLGWWLDKHYSVALAEVD